MVIFLTIRNSPQEIRVDAFDFLPRHRYVHSCDSDYDRLCLDRGTYNHNFHNLPTGVRWVSGHSVFPRPSGSTEEEADRGSAELAPVGTSGKDPHNRTG